MKKQFLTFALLTTVVAGGATLSANADTFYSENVDGIFTTYVCEGGEFTCADIIQEPVYRSSEEGNQGPVVEQGDLESVLFTSSN